MKKLTIFLISLTTTFSSAQLFDDLDNVLKATTKMHKHSLMHMLRH
jgi:hypothetical protein